MIDREKLVEETARAIFEVEYPDHTFTQLGEAARAFRIQQARAALSVFEKALAEPSDAQFVRPGWAEVVRGATDE